VSAPCACCASCACGASRDGAAPTLAELLARRDVLWGAAASIACARCGAHAALATLRAWATLDRAVRAAARAVN